MTIARQLSEFICTQAYDALPEQAVEHAEMLIASTVASSARGQVIESTQIIRDLELERGGKQESSVWFNGGRKIPATAAARVNALASDAAASDDSHLDFIIHHGTTVCSAAIAVGEATNSSGRDTLAAIAVGYEVTSRLIAAMHFPFKDKGFHGCIVAGFSSAAATSRLLGMDAERTAHAIALAATSIGGLAAAANTSTAREYHAGFAAMQGINAAMAAERGFKGELGILEHDKGFLKVYGSHKDVPGITQGLGERWSLLADLGIKLAPGGHPNHAVAEAAALAAKTGGVAAEDVEEITVARPGYQGFANPHEPGDFAAIAHSAIYAAAAAVTDHEFVWDHLTETKMSDPRILSLMGRVRMIDPPTSNLERFKAGAIVSIRLKDGRVFPSTVYAPKGSAVLGISWADIRDKYLALVPYSGMAPTAVEESFDVIRDFRSQRDVAELTALLA